MSSYVVTGGAGFIGSHLTEALLRAGHGVRVVDDLSTGRRDALDPAVEFIDGDVTDLAVMRKAVAGAAGIFHLAAITSDTRCRDDWSVAHRVNQGGTVAVFDAAREAGGLPVCYASSAAVYGDQGSRAIQEGAKLRPRGSLGADKLGSEHHGAVAFAQHGVPNLGLRMFHIYGPRRGNALGHRDVVSIFAERILAGQVITLHGDGQQCRDFVHVADVVRHFFAGMQMLQMHPQTMVLNLCTGRGTTIRGLADALGIAGARIPLVQFGPARPGDLRALLGDPNEAIHVLGVEAGIELESGLRSLFPAPPPSALEWARRAPMPRMEAEAATRTQSPRRAGAGLAVHSA
ncbi:NAD-dependent epimerase/dehydratase family protein [Sediminicoccus sp. KRV36]|uniref:NAD-dependent epimerase/dehydratase family protein n=1 Tax=Sediminicoccus sp. KRV36 TaxID=3133721 RepID=UPI00200D63A9|nr:NAD-dependent epimerase/dehydratase family protein [Sediminicoccus rosea]UPY36763.1 NAD-dependent epimerase/dehydratase family protein [Sediminicoccus rosea]